MEIHITWTKIIVGFCSWQVLRYGYHTYMKLMTACMDPFDPTVPFDAAMIARDSYRETLWELNREREKNEQQSITIRELQAQSAKKTKKKKA